MMDGLIGNAKRRLKFSDVVKKTRLWRELSKQAIHTTRS